MDARNVSLKIQHLIQQDRKENQQYRLIDIGSCGLHTIHNAFKTVAVQTDWKMKKILKAVYQIFHESVARGEDYFTVTVPISFIHYFVQQGWGFFSMIYLFTLPKIGRLENRLMK